MLRPDAAGRGEPDAVGHHRPVPRVTLQTIADKVGVSRMTVSNAFSRPDQLSASLREHILAVADELGYAGPDPAARALVSGTAGAIGVVLSDSLVFTLTDDVAMSFLAGIAEQLGADGRALTLLTAAPGDGSMPARDVAIDGAVIYSCHSDSTAISWLLRRHLPVVFVDQAPAAGIPSVNVDDRSGARAAAEHLVGLGHRRVGIVTTGFGGEFGLLDDPLGGPLANTERQRLVGWMEGLARANVVPTVVRVPHTESQDIGYEGARTLLALDEPPTALLCFSDAIAVGAVAAIQDTGRSVPGDLSVVGFDDSPIARRTSPTLTTVRQDSPAKGRAAAELLVAALDAPAGTASKRARHIQLATELVVRDSTARPPRGRRTG
jgi:DNA-binding LacI/PurR family transcriptional regulator